MSRLLATGYINEPFYVYILKWSIQITAEMKSELSPFLKDMKTHQPYFSP